MIVYDLSCAAGHRFEGWFASSSAFDSQAAKGLLACPECGISAVSKAPMAPAVPRKSNQIDEAITAPVPGKAQPAPAATFTKTAIERKKPAPALANAPLPKEVVEALGKLAEAQAAALQNSTWVGSSFAEKSRAMHYGEEATAQIHGQATVEEAKALMEEGIAVAPLPFPIAPPDELN